MFSFISQGDTTITSSNINVQGVHSSFASLLLAQGSLVINDSILNFQFSGTGIGGLIFSSQGIISDNCSINFLISTVRGGIFAYSAQIQINLQYFKTTGTFTIPAVNLVQVCDNLDIITWEVTILTQIFNKCGSGTCNCYCDSFSISTYCEKTEISLTSAQIYTEKSYFTIGLYNINCSFQNSFNNTLINIDINIVGKGMNYSVFCTNQAYNHVIVSGNYVAKSTSTSSEMIAALFINNYQKQISVQNCLLNINFTATNWFYAYIFQSSKSLDVTISNIRLNMSFTSNGQSQYYGLLYEFNASYLVLIKHSLLYYNITSTDIFIGVMFMVTQYITLQNLYIQYNVTNSNKNFGLSWQLVNAIYTNLELTGKINGNEWIRGITDNIAQGYFKVSNMIYSLQLYNIKSSACTALVKDMSKATSITFNNITFQGYARLNSISFLYAISSKQCITYSLAVSNDGMCYCPDTATPQLVNSVRVCKCPGSQTLSNNKCV
ncbi:Hypothetical_protein [Hexamita inflata]|uniref:Hypothetical_protein n=1 Tax=Hexamita inflata TaxID=28002 RepID=A0AA86PX86_9EUKA|nr:Hypothetical protein HINF_LOCUS33068 [Hexamita inflata]